MALIITIASFSFQISGAVILILWSLGSCDKKITSMCLEQNNGPLWLDMDDNIIIDKESLQFNAKTVYKNIFAFFDIAIGYICAMFAESSGLRKICVFGIVIIVTTVIVILESWLTKVIAQRKYPQDIKLSKNAIQPKVGQLALQVIEKD